MSHPDAPLEAPWREPEGDWEDQQRDALAEGLPVIGWATTAQDIWNTNPSTPEEHTP